MLGITTPIVKMAQEIKNALRDAMELPEFADIRFYRYVADDNRDDAEMNDLIFGFNRDEITTKRLEIFALEIAKKIKHHNYADKSVQGYESIVGTFTAEGNDGLLYDITEQITGDDGLEWELEYLPADNKEYNIKKANGMLLCFSDGNTIIYGDLTEAENDLCAGEEIVEYIVPTPVKNKYTVNVHFDMVATVEVIAENEDEALQLAKDEAMLVRYSKMDCVGSEACITNVEKI